MKACREALAELDRLTQRNVGKRALRAPAEVIAGRVKANAPVSSRPGNKTPGSLRASVEVKSPTSSKGRARITIVADDVAAVPMEFGRTGQPARPFFRPAVDSASDAAGEAMAGRSSRKSTLQ